MLWLFLFFISALLWCLFYLFERRSLAIGFFALMAAFFLGVYLIDLVVTQPEWFSSHLLAHIFLDIAFIFVGVLLIAYPAVLFPVFFIGGVILLKREGFRFKNILSFGFAVALMIFDLVFPRLFDVRQKGPASALYWYLTLVSIYFVIQLASFGLSNLFNLIHVRKNRGLDYVIVLGAGLSRGKPTPLLKSRIFKGIEIWRNNPGSKLIFSGGQGSDEAVSEGFAMAEFALAEGVPEDALLREEESKNTEENLRFSLALAETDSGKDIKKLCFGVATTSYHVMRALIISRSLRMRSVGFGAKTKLYYTLNAFLREYIGYFRDTRLIQLLQLAGLTIIYILFLLSRW
ncbi:MAG: YdcF family protein [Lachnospiraceae bacterium]|nr:YdcF family protein [Lachnospiraceae bacterium]